MHAGALRVGGPCRQRRVRHRLAGGDVFVDPLRNLRPAGCLPGLERTDVPAVAPAHRKVDIARRACDVREEERGVVEQVAMDGPEELRLRIAARTQFGEFLAWGLELEDRGDVLADCACSGDILGFCRVEHENVLAHLAEETRPGLLAQCPLAEQRLQHWRRVEVAVPRVFRQAVAHRFDDVIHRVQADDIGGAVGGALRMADGRSGQRIDHVIAELELRRMVHRREHREDADAIADEVRRVLRVDDALAERRREERLEAGQHGGQRLRAGDQFDEVHVARRIEEVHAAESLMQMYTKNIR